MAAMQRNERLLWLLMIGIFAFNKVDFMLTLDALELGFREANPLLAPLVGTPAFALVKLLGVPVLLLVVWRLRHQVGDRLAGYMAVPFGAYFSLMIYFHRFLPL